MYLFYSVQYVCSYHQEVIGLRNAFHFSIRVYFTYTTGYSTVKGEKKIFGISDIFEMMGKK